MFNKIDSICILRGCQLNIHDKTGGRVKYTVKEGVQSGAKSSDSGTFTASYAGYSPLAVFGKPLIYQIFDVACKGSKQSVNFRLTVKEAPNYTYTSEPG